MCEIIYLLFIIPTIEYFINERFAIVLVNSVVWHVPVIPVIN